jgi:hypothetical protein
VASHHLLLLLSRAGSGFSLSPTPSPGAANATYAVLTGGGPPCPPSPAGFQRTLARVGETLRILRRILPAPAKFYHQWENWRLGAGARAFASNPAVVTDNVVGNGNEAV